MRVDGCLLFALVALLGACAGRAALAATDPVYVTSGAGGRPVFSNAPLRAESRLMLGAFTREVAAFRSRFRASPDTGPAAGPVIASRRGTRALPNVPLEIDRMLVHAARNAGVDADLVRALVLVESGFQPNAHSHANARGLMQMLPATGARYGVRDLFDPGLNLQAGTRHLADLLRRFDGDVSLALAGYNAGEGAVMRHGRRIPPYAETQAYVPAVLSAWRRFRDSRATHGEQ